MGNVVATGRVAVGYAAAALSAIGVYALLPTAARPTAYFLISLSPLIPALIAVRHTPPGHRRPAWLLLYALAILSVGNLLSVITLAYRVSGDPATWPVTVGHVLFLAAALQVVRQHGRSNIGGVIDATVVAIGLAGILWTLALQPRLVAHHAGFDVEASLLIIVLSLAGIFGALLRLELLARESLPALRLFMAALLFGMVGNVGHALVERFLTVDRSAWIEIVFMLSYVAIGTAAAHPSMVTLALPGRPVVDDLSWTRLFFLGAALGVNPIVAGVQQRMGRQVDAMLVAIVTAVIVPLVMARIGVLSAQRARAEQALSYQASHDALTGLLNRAELLARLTASLRPGSGPPPVVLFCDLNGFKAVNDRLGHAAGDELLRQVARRLSGCLRDGDILGRYGGDEFVVLCAQATPKDAVSGISERISRAFSTPFDISGETVNVGVSVGVMSQTAGMEAATVLEQADAAMYRAKRNRDGSKAVSLHVALRA